MSPLIRRFSLLALIVVVGCDSNPTGPASASSAAPGAAAVAPAPTTKVKVGRGTTKTAEGQKPTAPD